MKYGILFVLVALTATVAAQKQFNPAAYYKKNKLDLYDQKRDSVYRAHSLSVPTDLFEDMITPITLAPYYDTVQYLYYRMEQTLHLRDIDKLYTAYGFTPAYALNAIDRMTRSGALVKDAMSNIIFLVKTPDGAGWSIMVHWDPRVNAFKYVGMSSQTDLVIQAGTYLFVAKQG